VYPSQTGSPSIPRLLLFAVPVIALVVVPIARFGIFHQPAASHYPPGDEREREPTEYRSRRPPGSAGGLR
jgi:hypothetical protein